MEDQKSKAILKLLTEQQIIQEQISELTLSLDFGFNDPFNHLENYLINLSNETANKLAIQHRVLDLIVNKNGSCDCFLNFVVENYEEERRMN